MNHLLSRFLRFRPVFAVAPSAAPSLIRSVLLAAVLLLPTMAVAQMAPQPMRPEGRGTAEEERACEPDARRLCRNVIEQGDMAVLACFQRQRAQLSRACAAVLRRHGQIP
jgi:hypothetical protein